MTARLPTSWKGGDSLGDGEAGGNASRTVPERHHNYGMVSPAMVDEAVANAAKSMQTPSDTLAVWASTMGYDSNGPVASVYYDAAAATARARVSGVVKKPFTINYVLKDSEVLWLTEYAPEYNIKFLARDSHDHPVMAAARILDHALIEARLPRGVPRTDIGGNPMVYIKRGAVGVHLCGPVVDFRSSDSKDASRSVLRRLEARKIRSSGADSRQVELASMYLDQDEKFVCGRNAQECAHPSTVLTAVHVYDIKMRDWPMIMEKKGAAMVEGCVLFSDSMFEQTKGELGLSGVRYEIDLVADKFAMGFVDSPSWWYEHSASEYLLYGASQVMYSSTHQYSYQIVERRGDTLFYRILRSDRVDTAVAETRAFRRPGYKMAAVNGFELSDSVAGGPLRRKKYEFPYTLWNDLVTQAAEDFERGVMDVGKMFNHYRTMSVRHTVNAVLVMGGQRVDDDQLVALVVHACLAAAAQSLLGQRVTRAITDSALRARTEVNGTILTKVRQVFSDMASLASLGSWGGPFLLLSRWLDAWKAGHFQDLVLDWEPSAEVLIREVPCIAVQLQPGVDTPAASDVLFRSARAEAPMDHFAGVVGRRMRDKLQGLGVKVPESVPGDGPGFCETVQSGSVVEPSVGVLRSVADAQRVGVDRVAAVREYLDEMELESRAVNSSCAAAYMRVTVRGLPNVAVLRRDAEALRNPDMWEVVNGVVCKSALGLEPSQFTHSAVYYPVLEPGSVSHVRSVRDHRYYDPETCVTTVRALVGDNNFCGWVLTNDSLQIFNGPDIKHTMNLALDVMARADFNVVVEEGVPGCGKTHSIIHEVVPQGGDVVLCSARESLVDTKSRILGLHPAFVDVKMRVRTIDSYLTNYLVGDTRNLRASRLLADECYMVHAAKWYAAAALLGVSQFIGFGDEQQIPHIPRVQAQALYVKLRPDETRNNWVSRRCPHTAVAAWNLFYGHRARSHSDQVGVMVQVESTVGREIPPGCAMLCMYQADKKALRAMYPAGTLVLTVHEAQGKTYQHVWLHRFDNRKRTDNFSLFDQRPHVLVAMSRHTHGFLYRCPAGLGDMVTQAIVRAASPGRLKAVADIVTAGQAVEFA